MNLCEWIIKLFMKFVEFVADKLPEIINEGFQTLKKASEVLIELITGISDWLKNL